MHWSQKGTGCRVWRWPICSALLERRDCRKLTTIGSCFKSHQFPQTAETFQFRMIEIMLFACQRFELPGSWLQIYRVEATRQAKVLGGDLESDGLRSSELLNPGPQPNATDLDDGGIMTCSLWGQIPPHGAPFCKECAPILLALFVELKERTVDETADSGLIDSGILRWP